MKVFFIGETGHANAQSWIKGIRQYSDFEIVTWKIESGAGRLSKVKRALAWLKACLTLGREIRQSGADILICERVTSYGFIGACTGFHPMVVSQQGVTDVWPPNSLSTPIKAAMARYAFKKADMIHAWGNVMVPAMLQLKADPAKIKIMPRGIDLQKFSFDIGKKKWDVPRAVVTRSLTADYRHDVILKAAKILKARTFPISIQIVGDGVLMPFLRTLAQELGVEDIVEFMGWLPNEQLPNCLATANLYLSVPATEGVSASLLEAFGSGLFPVISHLPGSEDWVDNKVNGILVPTDNPEALADAIQEAWKNKDQMISAILANRKLAEDKADFSKNMPQFVAWYRDLVNAQRGSQT